MSQPEISRRCLECGASVRQSEGFCPQCGADMGAARETEAAGADLTSVGEDVGGVPVSTEEVEKIFSAWQATKGVTPQVTRDAGAGEHGPARGAQDSPAGGASSQAPGPPGAGARPLALPLQQQRRRAVAAVRDNLRPRAEKLREASAGVLEEASEDTGLRFVLVAVFAFVVFLVLLLLTFLFD